MVFHGFPMVFHQVSHPHPRVQGDVQQHRRPGLEGDAQGCHGQVRGERQADGQEGWSQRPTDVFFGEKYGFI